MADLCRRFGENLKRSRRLAGLSQEELSVRAGLHRTEIGNLERGLRTPRLDTIVKLAGALEAAPAELLVGMAWWPGRSSSPGSFDFSCPSRSNADPGGRGASCS
jgi:transcriptional regulator with XRE-family HTH domain